MGLRPGSQSPDCTIKSYIDTSYDNVKTVSDNIDDVNKLASEIDTIKYGAISFVQEEVPTGDGLTQGARWYKPSEPTMYIYYINEGETTGSWVEDNSVGDDVSLDTIEVDGGVSLRDYLDSLDSLNGALDTRVGTLETDVTNLTGRVSVNETKLTSIESGAQVNTVKTVSGKTGNVTLDGSDINVTDGTLQNKLNSIDSAVDEVKESLTLKVFQSPTDNLTKVTTYAGSVGTVYEVRKTSDDSLATIYSDAAGTTEIVQDGTSNVSDSAGVVEFYINDGSYYVEVGGVKSRFNTTITIKNNNEAGLFSQKALSGETPIIKCYGDSLTYGFDVVTGTAPPINGSPDARAAITYPNAMADALSLFYGLAPSIYNRGYPGDTSENWRTRWPNYEYSDATFIMYGTNDSRPNGSVPTVGYGRYKENVRDLIKREIDGGTPLIVLLQPPELLNKNTVNATVEFRSKHIATLRNAVKELSIEFGLPCIDVEELTGHLGAYAYSDNTHFNQYGYNEWGFNLASILMPNGLNIGYSIGDKITPNNSTAFGWLTLSSDSKYEVGSNRVAFSLLNNSRPAIYVYGYFNEDCVIKSVSINSTATSTQTILTEVGGGDRSGLSSQSVIVSNDGSHITKRSISKLDVKKGYRMVLVKPVTSIATVEELQITTGNLARSDNKISKSYGYNFLKPLSTGNTYLATGATLEQGGYCEAFLTMATTGTGLLLSKSKSPNGFPTSYVWVYRLNETSLYIRKFSGVTPTDETIAGVFTTGVDDYKVSMYFDPVSDSIEVFVDDSSKATITGVSGFVGSEPSVGLYSNNPANEITVKSFYTM